MYINVLEADVIDAMIREVGLATKGLKPENMRSKLNSVVIPALRYEPINPTKKIPVIILIKLFGLKSICLLDRIDSLFLAISLLELIRVMMVTKVK